MVILTPFQEASYVICPWSFVICQGRGDRAHDQAPYPNQRLTVSPKPGHD
ncbi:hypothetical protein [Coleofasciculus sp. F4-SAH-05]